MMAQSASLPGWCVVAMIIVMMDQMSGWKPARTGSVLKAIGNVLIAHGASMTLWCVMEMHRV